MLKPSQFRAFLCTIVVLIGLLEFLYDSSYLLTYIAGAAGLVAFVVIIPVTSLYTRVIALILFVSGAAAIYFSGEASAALVIEGFEEMVPLVALLAAVTFLGVPLELGRYAVIFQRFYYKAKRMYQPYIISLLITYFLSLLSSLGSVAPSYYLIHENLQKLGLEKNSRFEATSIARAYAMAVIISPVSINVAIALRYTGLTWVQLAGPVFFLSLAGLAAAFLLEPSWRSKASVQTIAAVESCAGGSGHPSEVPAKQLISFFFLFACVVSSIFVFSNVLHFSAINSISLGCLLSALAWGAFSGHFRPLLSRGITFFGRDINKLSEQILLFIVAGFFTYSMERSGLLILLSKFVQDAAGVIGSVALLSLVPVIIITLAVIGFHPFASGIIIAKTLSVSNLYFNPLGVAVALMCGMSMSFILSPFSVLSLMLSAFTKKSPYRVSLHWNIVFAVVFWGLSTAFIALVTRYF